MSMNFYAAIYEEVKKPHKRKKGKFITVTACVAEFPVFQTPTHITNNILKAENPLEAYLDWVRDTRGNDLYLEQRNQFYTMISDHPNGEIRCTSH